MQILRFYLGDITDFATDAGTKAGKPLHSVNILEGPEFQGTFTVIETIQFDRMSQFVTTTKAADNYTQLWYRLQFIGDPAVSPVVVLGTTEPILPEIITDMIDEIRAWIGDTNLEEPAWTDSQYLQELRFALKQYKGDKNLTFLRDEDWVPIQLLVRESFAANIAYDTAKYYALQNPTAQLDMSQISVHYTNVARLIKEQYTSYAQRLNMQSGGYDEHNIVKQMPGINIVTAARYSHTLGRTVTKGPRPAFSPRTILG